MRWDAVIEFPKMKVAVLTRDVNGSVIALQKDIISAQTALKTASDGLVEQILAAREHRDASAVIRHTLRCGTAHSARTTRYSRRCASPPEIHVGSSLRLGVRIE